MPDVPSYDDAAFEAYKKNTTPVFSDRAYEAAKAGASQGQNVSGPALASEAVEGMPIIGAYGPKAGAAFQAATQPWLGLGSNAPTYEQRRDENLARHEARQSTFKEKNPLEATGAQLGGGALAMGLLPPELLGITELPGVTGPLVKTLQRMSLGSATNAAVSGADAAARGQDVGQAANLGAVVGAGVPLIGTGIGNTARYLAANHPQALKDIAGAGAPLMGSLLGLHFAPDPVSGAGIGSILGWGAKSGSEKLADWMTGRIARSDPATSLGSLAAWPYAIAPGAANRFQNQPLPGFLQPQTPYGAQ